MSYLTITFDGVVAIGPPEPRDGRCEEKGPLFAVMPRSNRHLSRWSMLNFDKPTYIPAHTPVLFTELKPVERVSPGLRDDYPVILAEAPDPRQPDEIFPYPDPPDPKDTSKKKFYIWYPMRERLEFRFDDEIEPGCLTYEVKSPDEPTLCERSSRTLSRGDIGAVSDMRDIWPDRCHLRKEVLSRRPPNEVAGQVFVPRGCVSSGDYGREESKGEEASFVPKRSPKTVTKCLVPQIQVSAEVKRFVHILSYSLDTGERLDSISFELPDNADADILIGNADHGDIRTALQNLVYPPKPGKPLRYDNRTDFDFELYYTLLEGEDDGGGLPVPRAIRFGNPHCYTAKVGGST